AYWPAWEQWFLGNALTNLALTPAILCWVFGTSWMLRDLKPRVVIEVSVLTAGLIVAGYAAFGTESVRMGIGDARFYAPVPFLFLAAARFGILGASGADRK